MPESVDWSRIPEPSGSDQHFKWGWNGETGEATVWRVDSIHGLPVHDTYLREAWGRPPSSEVGDCLGIAEATKANLTAEGDGADPVVYIRSFYGKHVPESVLEWFRAALPDHAPHAVTTRVAD